MLTYIWLVLSVKVWPPCNYLSVTWVNGWMTPFTLLRYTLGQGNGKRTWFIVHLFTFNFTPEREKTSTIHFCFFMYATDSQKLTWFTVHLCPIIYTWTRKGRDIHCSPLLSSFTQLTHSKRQDTLFIFVLHLHLNERGTWHSLFIFSSFPYTYYQEKEKTRDVLYISSFASTPARQKKHSLLLSSSFTQMSPTKKKTEITIHSSSPIFLYTWTRDIHFLCFLPLHKTRKKLKKTWFIGHLHILPSLTHVTQKNSKMNTITFYPFYPSPKRLMKTTVKHSVPLFHFHSLHLNQKNTCNTWFTSHFIFFLLLLTQMTQEK